MGQSKRRRDAVAGRAQGGGVQLAQGRPAAPSDERGYAMRVGFAGTMAGLEEDYASAWQLPTRWETTEKMVTDPAVSACLSALTFPVLASKLKVEAASDDPEDKKLAEFIEAGLENMTTGLQRHRLEALGMVGEGVRVFETVYERRDDGYWHLRKLALRPNRLTAHWHVDETGGPDGITQHFDIASGKKGEKLPMERLLAFTHLADGPSLLGRPATRAMYRPYYLLDKLARIGAVAIERHGVGVPWAKYTGGSDEEGRKVDRALALLHGHERVFFRVDDQTPEWGIRGVEGTVLDPVPFMEYQRRDLFLASLAQFLALGTDNVGSMALSSDQSGFFMLAVRFIAGEVEDVYNRFLVPRWIGYNWTVPSDRLPRIKHGTIDQRSALEWAQAVAQVVAAGVQLPQEELRTTAARLLGLTVNDRPEEDLPDVQDVNAPEEAGQGGGEGVKAAWAGVTLSGQQLESVAKMEALGIAPRFAEMAGALDQGRDRIIARVQALQAKQARRLTKIGAKLIRDGDAARVAALLAGDQGALGSLELASPPRRLVSYSEEAEVFASEMDLLYEQGWEEYSYEVEQQGGRASDPSAADQKRDRAMLVALGLVAGALLADRMANAWAAETLRQMGAGLDVAALSGSMTGLAGSLLADLAAQRVNAALGLGRAAGALANGDVAPEVLYTAMMDANVCEVCAGLDGTVFPVDKAPRIPNPECYGKDRCRCELVPVVDKTGSSAEE